MRNLWDKSSPGAGKASWEHRENREWDGRIWSLECGQECAGNVSPSSSEGIKSRSNFSKPLEIPDGISTPCSAIKAPLCFGNVKKIVIWGFLGFFFSVLRGFFLPLPFFPGEKKIPGPPWESHSARLGIFWGFLPQNLALKTKFFLIFIQKNRCEGKGKERAGWKGKYSHAACWVLFRF